jgi:RluA family pseudouridine synthase
MMLEYKVSQDAAGQRLDKFLRKRLESVPLSHLYKLVRTKKVRVNGARTEIARLLEAGDVITVHGARDEKPAPAEKPARAVKQDFKVIYEDDAILVCDKPAGLAIHPGTGLVGDTLVDQARAYLERQGLQLAEGEFKPSPAHRLDRETSGLVACGRGSIHTRALKAAFAARQVEKAYLALCEGEPPREDLHVDVPLSVGTERIKVKAHPDPNGLPAATVFRVLSRYRDGAGKPLALLRCEPRTGRQHQIRAHLLAAGFPLVGDKLYGPDEGIFFKLAESGGAPAPRGTFDDLITGEERRALRHFRQALHASELTLPHPVTGERLRFESPLPEDLRQLLSTLTPA